RDVESGDSLCADARRVALRGGSPSGYGRSPSVCGRSPSGCGRSPSDCGRSPSGCGRSPSDCGCAHTKNAPGKPRGWLVGRSGPTTAVDHHHVGLVLAQEQGEDLPLGDGVVEALHLVVFIVGDEVATVAERPDVAREALFPGDRFPEADQGSGSHVVAVDGVDGEGGGGGVGGCEAGHWNLLVSWWGVSLSVCFYYSRLVQCCATSRREKGGPDFPDRPVASGTHARGLVLQCLA